MQNNTLTKPRFPAEWESQDYVMLTWPSLEDNAWDASQQADVHTCFTEIANTVLQYQNLLIVCNDEEHYQYIQERLEISKFKVTFFQCDTDDVWARDHGPITVFNNDQSIWNDFTFDGWGKKFDANNDNLITPQLQQALFENVKPISFKNVLEGGALETDGQGTLLTTASCVLDKVRNPDVTEDKFRQLALNALGCDRVFILEHGHLQGDDTDGHIDTLARFSDAETIVFQSCFDKNDVHFASLQKMEAELKELRTQDNRPYRLSPLPLPEATFNKDGDRLPASYANFLIINEAVLYPRYNDVSDDEVGRLLQTTFPDRNIHGIDCSVLVEQYGSLHCVTMQLPKLTP